jgi:hypothetical protein
MPVARFHRGSDATGGHRLERLAAPIQHQPTQVALTAGTLVLARQRLEHISGERLQTSADSVWDAETGFAP